MDCKTNIILAVNQTFSADAARPHPAHQTFVGGPHEALDEITNSLRTHLSLHC